MPVFVSQGRRDAPGGLLGDVELLQRSALLMGVGWQMLGEGLVAVFLLDVADVEKYLLQGFSAVLHQKVLIENYF